MLLNKKQVRSSSFSETLSPLDDFTIAGIRGAMLTKRKPHVLSLGGGKQSSTLFLKNLRGEIDPPANFAIFADTMWEREETYTYLDYLDELATQHRFPKIWRVSAGNIKNDMLSGGLLFKENTIPFWTLSENGKNVSMIQRRCSRHYKVFAIRREIRKVFSMNPYTIWIGFSLDEVSRRNDSRFPSYQTPRYPLLEQRLTRDQCVDYLEANKFEVPVKSSCVCCPYRKHPEWLDMLQNNPKEFSDAVDFGKQMKSKLKNLTHFKNNALPEEKGGGLYLTRLLKDLDQIDLDQYKGTVEADEAECGHGCFI